MLQILEGVSNWPCCRGKHCSASSETRQDKRRFWAKFCLISADGTPSTVHIYGICLFLPIFCLKWYPILVINSSMVPISHFSTHMFTDSAFFPPMVCSFSVYFPPNLPPIFRRSCREMTFLKLQRTIGNGKR